MDTVAVLKIFMDSLNRKVDIEQEEIEKIDTDEDFDSDEKIAHIKGRQDAFLLCMAVTYKVIKYLEDNEF